MKATKLTTQKVVGILKTAGFKSYIRTRRVHRRGFGVRKLSRFVVGVLDYGTDLDGCGYALAEAGLRVTRINEGALKVADLDSWMDSI